MRAAESRSSRFVNDSSFPCRMSAAPNPHVCARTTPPSDAGFRRSEDRAALEGRGPVDAGSDVSPGAAARTERPPSVPCPASRQSPRRTPPVCANALRARSNRNAGRARRGGERLEHRSIVLRIDNHEHVAKVLRRGPDEAWTADVDLLDEIIEAHFLASRRLHKRIQIDDDEVDQADAVGPRGSRSRWLRRARMPP